MTAFKDFLYGVEEARWSDFSSFLSSSVRCWSVSVLPEENKGNM